PSSSLPRLRLRSTFFPYTTLFRSENGLHCRRTLSAGTASASSLAKFARCGVFGHVLFPQESPPYVTAIQVKFLKINVDEFYLLKDRKSTRLNSSHVSISYAVFCLK